MGIGALRRYKRKQNKSVPKPVERELTREEEAYVQTKVQEQLSKYAGKPKELKPKLGV